MEIESFKKLATAVILQACKDYKNRSSERPHIEKWICDGNIYTDLMLPDMSADDIIRGFKRYANKKET